MGAFVISKRFNNKYKFAFTSKKGKTIYTSLNFELKFECEQQILKLKENIDTIAFVQLKASNGKYFFKTFLGNQHIANSRNYTTELRIQKAIEEIKIYTFKAEILDFSENNFTFSDNL